MPNIKVTGLKSEINQDLRNKRRKIIEEERIRVLGDALMLFYDKLMEEYKLLYKEVDSDKDDDGKEVMDVSRKEIEEFARKYAETKPIGY